MANSIAASGLLSEPPLMRRLRIPLRGIILMAGHNVKLSGSLHGEAWTCEPVYLFNPCSYKGGIARAILQGSLPLSADHRPGQTPVLAHGYPLAHFLPASHVDGLTGHVARLLGGQKHNHIGHVLVSAAALHRDLVHVFLADLFLADAPFLGVLGI